MNIQITLNCTSVEEAADAMARLAVKPIQGTLISSEDRPDAGAPASDPVAAAVFGIPPSPPAAALPTLPAAAPTAPSAATAPTDAPAGPERDSKGMPWDARIHAANKATNTDGSWRKKRSVEDALVATVEAELRGVVLPPAAPALPPAAAAAAPPVLPGVIPPQPPAAPIDFGQLMVQLSPHFAANAEKTNAVIARLLAPHGMVAVGQLASQNPALLSQFKADFDAAMAA